MALRQVIQQKMSDVAPQVLEECSTSPVFAQMGRTTAPSNSGTPHDAIHTPRHAHQATAGDTHLILQA